MHERSLLLFYSGPDALDLLLTSRTRGAARGSRGGGKEKSRGGGRGESRGREAGNRERVARGEGRAGRQSPIIPYLLYR